MVLRRKNRVEAIEYKKKIASVEWRKWREYPTEVHCYFKNYRNHSQALKVVLYDNANENSKSYPVPKPVYLQNMRQSNSNFKFLFLIIEVLKR